MIKDQNDNIINNITNDVLIAGTDLFADSEDFLNELTDSDLVQVTGGGKYVFENQSTLTLVLCELLGPI